MWLSITGDLCGLALGERGRSERSCLRPENVLSVSFHLLDPRTCGPGTQSRPGSTYLRVYAASYPDGAQVLLGPLGRSPAFYFIACFIPNHHIGLTQTLQTAQLVPPVPRGSTEIPGPEGLGEVHSLLQGRMLHVRLYNQIESRFIPRVPIHPYSNSHSHPFGSETNKSVLTFVVTVKNHALTSLY